MPTSSNPTPPSTPDIEDIFADSDSGQPQNLPPEPLSTTPLQTEPSAAVADAMVEEPLVEEPASNTASSYQPPIDPTRRRRLWLIIGIVVSSLLLLGGIGTFVWFWLQRPQPVDVTSINDTTNSVINTNQPPLNIELNTNTADTTNTNNTNTADTFIDVDHDGLSDQEELIANTNPKKKDTDDDGLSDREEVRVYLTDPRDADTDDDSYVDGVEVANFYHPNDPDPKKRLFDLPN